MEVRIYKPRTRKEFEKYYDLRWRILRKPWNQPKGSERDEYENSADHIMACMGDKVVGVGRVHFNSEEEAQIRYMAVEEGYEGKGIGRLILKELEEKAKEKGAKYIMLNARENAVKFYRKYGYKIIRKSHTLFGCIQHWEMQKGL